MRIQRAIWIGSHLPYFGLILIMVGAGVAGGGESGIPQRAGR